LERYNKYNQAGFGYRTLTIIYANLGREQEARSMLEKATEGYPPTIKNVRYMMTKYPLKDLKVMQRIAESYSKAGLPGKPSEFYKISAENRLTGKEMRELFFGGKVTGFNMTSGKQWWIERNQDGKATVRDGDNADTGKSWVEKDMLCNQWDNLYESLKDCWDIYRNPEGTPENDDEYIGAPGYGIFPFSPVN
jgi:adenylate cyclase